MELAEGEWLYEAPLAQVSMMRLMNVLPRSADECIAHVYDAVYLHRSRILQTIPDIRRLQVFVYVCECLAVPEPLAWWISVEREQQNGRCVTPPKQFAQDNTVCYKRQQIFKHKKTYVGRERFKTNM